MVMKNTVAIAELKKRLTYVESSLMLRLVLGVDAVRN
jgi:hypothetical protein